MRDLRVWLRVADQRRQPPADMVVSLFLYGFAAPAENELLRENNTLSSGVANRRPEGSRENPRVDNDHQTSRDEIGLYLEGPSVATAGTVSHLA